MFEAKYSLVKPDAISTVFNVASEHEARVLAREFASARPSADQGEFLVLTGIVDHQTGKFLPVEQTLQPPPAGFVDVHWSVRVRADSPEAGAAVARFMQFDPSSLASVYRCCDASGAVQVVDLQGAVSSPH